MHLHEMYRSMILRFIDVDVRLSDGIPPYTQSVSGMQ